MRKTAAWKGGAMTQTETLRLCDAGLSLIPVKTDGSKAAALPSWKIYQKRLPNDSELRQWFGNGARPGIAIIGGKVSGNLEVIDFDAPELISEWRRLVEDSAPRLLAQMPQVETPSGGLHVFYRCAEITGNSKLAMKADGHTLIETRGEGGYVIAAGSPATVHHSGKLYKLINGDMAAIPEITPAQREILLDCARSFNERIKPEPAQTTSAPSGLRPGDDYNGRGDSRADLERHGWRYVGQGARGELWRRPDKDSGVSATRFPDGSLYVFSSNAAPFEMGREYKPFSILTMLDHDGDFGAAAKALAADGFGERTNNKTRQMKNDNISNVGSETENGAEEIRLAVSWADFEAEEFIQGERIAFAVERGEIVLLNALPNAGKTTLAINTAISLASGRRFPPLVTEPQPRRVLYIDGETRRARLQRDIRTMMKDFSHEELLAVRQNLHIICEVEINGESLALTDIAHLLQISVDALRVKPDFIVVDTFSSLCPVFNENDNAEQSRRVWRPLQKLARDCDAAILVLHHIGKRNEDSQASERVYRGRGASASGAAARSVWLLAPDPVKPGLSTLSCVKAKGECPADVRLQLNAETRWMRQLEVVAPQPTQLEIVAAKVTREMKTAEIVAVLSAQMGERAVKDYLAEAVEQGLIRKVKYGVYGPKSAENAESAKGQNAQSAQSAQSPENENAENAEVIGNALSAFSDKANETNNLPKSAENARPIEDCTLCTLENGDGPGPDDDLVEIRVILDALADVTDPSVQTARESLERTGKIPQIQREILRANLPLYRHYFASSEKQRLAGQCGDGKLDAFPGAAERRETDSPLE
jgi:hypothetical protein